MTGDAEGYSDVRRNRSRLAAFDRRDRKSDTAKTGLAAPFARQEENDEYYR
jgi:hypothetical protein